MEPRVFEEGRLRIDAYDDGSLYVAIRTGGGREAHMGTERGAGDRLRRFLAGHDERPFTLEGSDGEYRMVYS